MVDPRPYKTSRSKMAEALRRALQNAPDPYQFPGALPVIGAPPWTALTAYSTSGTTVSVGNWVYALLKAGTSASGSGPSGKGEVIQDGTAYWTFLGYLAPVAYANSQALFADQIVYNGGKVFRALGDGTTASSGSGPTPSSLTDGTVTFACEGLQTLPLVVNSASATVGNTQQVTWNSPKATILGGNIIQQGANARGGIASRSGDGQPYSEANGEGGGSVFTVTDAPKADFTFTNNGAFTAWADGRLLAFVNITTTSQRYLTIDCTGCERPRIERVLRFEIPWSIKYAGFMATGFDSFSAYTPRVKIKAVIVGDSFVSGSNFRVWALQYATKLGHFLGIDDWRVSGIGGTGVITSNGANAVSYTDRFTQDVINQAPGLVIIQQSQNDQNPINGGTATLASLAVAQQALIDRVKNELPGAYQISLGVWNNRAPLSSAPASLGYLINQQATTMASASAIPFIDWSDYLTDGGFVGSTSGTGNSAFYTGDGTHPTISGDDYRARRLRSPFADVIRQL